MFVDSYILENKTKAIITFYLNNEKYQIKPNSKELVLTDLPIKVKNINVKNLNRKFFLDGNKILEINNGKVINTYTFEELKKELLKETSKNETKNISKKTSKETKSTKEEKETKEIEEVKEEKEVKNEKTKTRTKRRTNAKS